MLRYHKLRRIKEKFGCAFTVGTSLILGLYFLYDFMDPTYESHYMDYEAAMRDGAIMRGWLPDWLPHTAVDIHEWHDLDSNEIEAHFTFDARDLTFLDKVCDPISIAEIGNHQFTAIQGWSTGDEGDDQPLFDHINFYRIRSTEWPHIRPTFFAVDRETGEAWYWSLY